MVQKVPNAMLTTGGASAGVGVVNAGTGISVTGLAATPTISNAGVLSLTAGAGISIGGTPQAPVVAASAALICLLQRKQSSTTAWATVTSTACALDDSLPLSSETQLVTSVAIAPTSGANYLDLFGSVVLGPGSAPAAGVICLFTDGVCIAVAPSTFTTAGGYTCTPSISFRVLAGSTASRTYELRVGTNHGSGNLAINGYPSQRLYGGGCVSSLTVDEVTP